MNNSFGDIFGDSFANVGNTSTAIMFQKVIYERKLDEMWENYSRGCVAQIGNYQKQINIIKNAGLRVLRNSSGKHIIAYNK